ncbi:MAG TPA: putative metallopeptidase [Candidatus Paceibacterota bacterium]|nr:putative metallopeptidase [Candidatus Paceibacterota bacterium]
MAASLYQRSTEIEEIIQELSKERRDIFGKLFDKVYPETIRATLRVDKDAPASQIIVLKIKGITGPLTALNDNIKFIIHGYESLWKQCSYERKIAWVANMLCHIEFPTEEEVEKLILDGKEYEYGKIKKPDISDFRTFLVSEWAGLDWTEKETKIGNILEDKNIKITL